MDFARAQLLSTDSGVKLTVSAGDVGPVPQEIRSGLSPVVADEVPVMGRQIAERYRLMW